MLLAEASLTSVTLVTGQFLLARTDFISISVVISRLYLLKLALIALGQMQLFLLYILREAFVQKNIYTVQKKANHKPFFIFKPVSSSFMQ